MTRVLAVKPRDPAVLLRATMLLFVILGAGAGRLQAQRTVVVYEEPHHRVVVDEGDVKLLDIQILPGDTTYNHTHDGPILYTFINLGNGPVGGRVTSNIQYAEEPMTHQVSNSGTELFRIIALANYSAGSEDVTAARPEGFTTDPEVEDRYFRSYRLQLEPGDETAILRHQNDAVIIQVSDGEAEVTNVDGFGANLDSNGDWTWRVAGSPYRVRNVGDEPITIVINEARRPR